VVLNPPSEETETMASTLEGNSQEKDNSIAQEEEENMGRPLKPPEKSPSKDEMTAKSNENVPGKADVTSETKATDGFQTPSKKH
jgi:hypothetical protein